MTLSEGLPQERRGKQRVADGQDACSLAVAIKPGTLVD
jgi:hypothetical protein